MLNLNLLAQAAPGSGGITFFLPIILIMVIFYVLLILPAQRRQKKTTQMLSALKNGDKDAIQLRIADQVKVKVLRSAVAGLQPESKES
jgi:preprotein translocase YajC subunit